MRIHDTVYILNSLVAGTRVGNKKPTQKTPKKPSKKLTKNEFLGFFKFFIFYENNTNFSR
jgi:hypothetical protein